MDKKIIEKEAIIAEYLTGNTSYRKIGIKYGIDFRLIHSWVMKYQGKKRTGAPKPKDKKEEEVPLSNEVKQLQRELRKAQLHNKLLNAMIDIAEDQLKIDIRKKSGTKR
ncbi:MAG: transposase [Bacteroidetes bacterium]|nr:transposase [Bacteroidota bacterium]